MQTTGAWKPVKPTAAEAFGLTLIVASLVLGLFAKLFGIGGDPVQTNKTVALFGVVCVAGFVVTGVAALLARLRL